MPFRRKLPRVPPTLPISERAQLIAEIAKIEYQERRVTLELEDVFTDVSTPEASDSEEEQNEEQNLPDHQLFEAETRPNQDVLYSQLYCEAPYRHNVNIKMRKMKKVFAGESLTDAQTTARYQEEYHLLRETYPEDGQRTQLFYLIAFYH